MGEEQPVTVPLNYRRRSTDDENFELQWMNSSGGGPAVGKSLIFDLFEIPVDAKNYEEAFRGAGYVTKYMHHPTVKVCSVIKEIFYPLQSAILLFVRKFGALLYLSPSSFCVYYTYKYLSLHIRP